MKEEGAVPALTELERSFHLWGTLMLMLACSCEEVAIGGLDGEKLFCIFHISS